MTRTICAAVAALFLTALPGTLSAQQSGAIDAFGVPREPSVP